ncbi:MAG: insulinase family protein [Alphaproteobacteria bacterium]|nr:insulinase family protein [Alphaproteobacteria bacterium]
MGSGHSSKHEMTVLPNGLTIFSENMPDIETVTISVWVNSGSRNEGKDEHGISHFLEHMAFKGTQTRTALDIAQQFDNIGGMFNAYTGRENTVYYAKVLKEDMGIALDILADILQHSTMNPDEIVKERNVILQEIASTHDTPDDIVFDYFQEQVYPGQALGRPILGTPETVSSFEQSHLLDYVKRYHCASNMIVSAAGNLDHDTLVTLAGSLFKYLPKGERTTQTQAYYTGGDKRIERDLEQVQFVLGFNGISYLSDDVYSLSMLADILGGGMSSRLFQEVREKRGLVYSIACIPHNYADGGIFSIYAGTGEEELPVLVDVIAEELHKITQNVTQDEMLRARNQVKAALLMAQESSTSRAEKLARHYLRYGRIIPLEETLEKLAAVKIQDVHNLMEKFLHTVPTVTAIGNLQNLPSYEHITSRIATR